MEVGFVRSEEAEAFAGAIIEALLYNEAVALGDVCERRTFGYILSDEAIGVFVGAAFPSVVRGSEVEGGAEFSFDIFIAVELGAVV